MEHDLLKHFIRQTENDFREVKKWLHEQDVKSEEKFDKVFEELKGAQRFEIRVTALVGLITVLLAPTVTLLTLWFKSKSN